MIKNKYPEKLVRDYTKELELLQAKMNIAFKNRDFKQLYQIIEYAKLLDADIKRYKKYI